MALAVQIEQASGGGYENIDSPFKFVDLGVHSHSAVKYCVFQRNAFPIKLIKVELPNLWKIRPPTRHFRLRPEMLWESHNHIRIGLDAIVVNGVKHPFSLKTIKTKPYSESATIIRERLSKSRKSFIRKLPEYLRERASDELFVNISADKNLSFHMLKKLMHISYDAGFSRVVVSVRHTYCENVYFELPPMVPTEDWFFNKEGLYKSSHILRLSLDADQNVLVHRRLRDGVSFKTPVYSLLDRLEKVRKEEPDETSKLVIVPVYHISDSAKVEDVLRLFLNTYREGDWEYIPFENAVIADEPPVRRGEE